MTKQQRMLCSDAQTTFDLFDSLAKTLDDTAWAYVSKVMDYIMDVIESEGE